MAIEQFKRRLGEEQGFSMIELLIVLMIVSTLAVIALPSYLSYRTRAQQVSVQTNVSSAVPAAEGLYPGSSSYATITRSTLIAQAPGLDPNVMAVSLNGGQGYCVEDTSGPWTYDYVGGSATPLGTWKVGTIQAATCLDAAGAAALST